MGRVQRIWARKAYDRLLLQLGGRCTVCGSLSGLTVDHIDGCPYSHRKLEWSYRISVYRREAAQGKLQILCKKCNAKKGRPAARTPPTCDKQPGLFGDPPGADDNCPF